MDRQPPPTLPAYADEQGQMHAWCGHCKQWHSHSRGSGRRTAACTEPKSPYRKTGYILRYAGAWTDEVKNKVTEAPPAP